jgi:hypothetical protein
VDFDDHRGMDRRGEQSERPARRDGRVVVVAIMLAAIGVSVLCYFVVIWGRAVGGLFGSFSF